MRLTGSNLNNSTGFSLVGVMVAAGIGAVIVGFIAEMIIFQYKDQKNLSQKIEISDFTNTLLSTFIKPSNCSCQFQNNATNPNLSHYTALHFNSTNTAGTEFINVKNIYSGCLGGTNPPLLLAGNDQLLYGTRDLIVDTVKLINLRPTGGSSNPRDWQGQWQIQFKVGPGSLSKPSPPVLVTQKFTIDDTNPSAALISSCNGISSGIGTTNYLSKWSGIPGMLMDSGILEEPALKRVGIGTTNPQRQLHIESTSDTVIRIDSPVANQNFIEFSKVGAQAGFIGMARDAGLFTGISTGDMAVRSQSTPLHLGTQSNPAISILTNNNVGIGTVGPGNPLTVNGTFAAAATVGNAANGCLRVQTFPASNGALDIGIHQIGPDNYAWLQARNKSDYSINTNLVLQPNGKNVGIGIKNPTFQFQLSNDSAAKPGTSTWTIASDERLKNVRAPFTRGLNEILGLNTIYFNYRGDNPLGLPSEKEFVGIRAQDAQKVIPEAVSTDEQGYLHLTNDLIIWTSVNAIKELYVNFLGHSEQLAVQARQIASKADKVESDALRAENLQLKQDNAKFMKENAEIKARLEKIEKALKLR